MNVLHKNRFLLLLVLLFMIADALLRFWDPMAHSLRFYKNDFVKTLYHHGWRTYGSVFYGNSSVTGAYMEDKSQFPHVELGLSYGKITDLKAILNQGRFQVTDELVIGIDVHTMLDKLTTDPTYPWFRNPLQPYLYEYRDYFRQEFEQSAHRLYTGLVELNPAKMFAAEPAWIDKELYFGHKDPALLQKDWERYEKLFNWMTLPVDFQQNLDALDWVIAFAKSHQLPLRVVWMPYNKSFAKPPYMVPLKNTVQQKLDAAGVPTLDLMNRYEPSEFHDIVHLDRETGAPLFTKEVDAWLQSQK